MIKLKALIKIVELIDDRIDELNTMEAGKGMKPLGKSFLPDDDDEGTITTTYNGLETIVSTEKSRSQKEKEMLIETRDYLESLLDEVKFNLHTNKEGVKQ